jgi:hypothetical protein
VTIFLYIKNIRITGFFFFAHRLLFRTKPNILEIGSASVLKWIGTYPDGFVRGTAGLNWIGAFSTFHLKMAINPVSQASCSLQVLEGPPLWSNGQSSCLQIQRSRVKFPGVPDFLRSTGPGTGSTQPREDNWGATWTEKKWLRSRKLKLTAVGIRCADQVTPSIYKSWH